MFYLFEKITQIQKWIAYGLSKKDALKKLISLKRHSEEPTEGASKRSYRDFLSNLILVVHDKDHPNAVLTDQGLQDTIQYLYEWLDKDPSASN